MDSNSQFKLKPYGFFQNYHDLISKSIKTTPLMHYPGSACEKAILHSRPSVISHAGQTWRTISHFPRVWGPSPVLHGSQLSLWAHIGNNSQFRAAVVRVLSTRLSIIGYPLGLGVWMQFVTHQHLIGGTWKWKVTLHHNLLALVEHVVRGSLTG